MVKMSCSACSLYNGKVVDFKTLCGGLVVIVLVFDSGVDSIPGINSENPCVTGLWVRLLNAQVLQAPNYNVRSTVLCKTVCRHHYLYSSLKMYILTAYSMALNKGTVS